MTLNGTHTNGSIGSFKKAIIAADASIISNGDDHAGGVPSHLRSMKLYSPAQVKYLLHRAVETAFHRGDELVTSDFHPFDMLHYSGPEGLIQFFTKYADQLSPGSSLLDLGSGVGGSSRYAHTQFNVQVTGVECQPELYKVCGVLSRLLGVEPGVKVLCGDFLTLPISGLEGSFDGAIAQLALLHVPNKDQLFSRLFQVLKPGAPFLIEDYYFADGVVPSTEETHLLRHQVAVPDGGVVSETDFRRQLANSGLMVDEWKDLTDSWSTFVWDRCEVFLRSSHDMRAKFGDEYVDELGTFYRTMPRLFPNHSSGDYDSWRLTHPLTIKTPPTTPNALRGVRIMGRRCR